MNNLPKKIIIVEDDKLLLTIFTLYIRELGHEIVGAFTKAEDAIECLKNNKSDVVLIDIELSDGMSGVEASKIIFLEYNTPTIYLTSYSDEQTLNTAFNYGVYGYLVKPVNKHNLSVTIDLVCWRHQYEQHRAISEQLLNRIDSAVITMSLNGRILFFNEVAKLIFENQNTSNQFFYEWINLSAEIFALNVAEEVLSRGFLSKNYTIAVEGKKKILQVNYTLLLDEIKEPYAIAVFATEITELVELSEEFKKIGSIQATMFNGINQMLFVFDKNNNLLLFNHHAQKVFQQKLNLFLKENKPIYDVFNFLTSTEIQSLTKNVFSGVYHFTERIIENKNNRFFFQINWLPVEIESEVIYSLVLISDITPLRELEQNYQELKDELKPIFDSSIQRFYLVDLNLNIIAFNKSAKDIIYKEFNRTLKKGENALDLVPQLERRKHFLEQFELAKQGHSVSFKESYPLKNELRWNETHLDPVIDDRGEIKRVLIWTLDVTEKENNLRELKESKERYELIARGGNDGIFDWDIIQNSVYLSPRWKALLGYEDYELKNEFGVRESLIHPDDKEKAKSVLNDYFEGKILVYENEFRLKHKQGYYIWIIERGEILKDEEGNKLRFAGSITDITRIKKTENDLLRINQTLLDERKMFMQGSVVITRIKADENKNFIYISENIKDVLAYTAEEFTNGSVTYDSLIHPEDLNMHTQEREEAIALKKQQISFSPYRMRRKDGSYIWVQDFSTLIQNDDGTTDILGYFIDITSQKRSEEELKASNKRYMSLFEEASDAIILIDEVRIIEANKNAEYLLGYTKEQLKQMDILMLSPEMQPNKEKSIERFNRKILTSIAGRTKAFYWQFLNNEKKIVDVEIGISPIVINNKRICYQAIIRNITERKKMEKMLKENERKVSALLESIPDLLFILDKNNTYIFFKPDKEKLFDIPHNQVIGKKMTDFFSGEILDQYLKCIDTCRKTNKTSEITYTMNSPQGLRKFEARMTLFNDEQILQVVRDLGPLD